MPLRQRLRFQSSLFLLPLRLREGIQSCVACDCQWSASQCALSFLDWAIRPVPERLLIMAAAPAAIGIQYNGTALSTAGPQNTPAVFKGFLDSYPDIATPTASLTFNGVTRSGPTLIFGTSILQQFTGRNIIAVRPGPHAAVVGRSLQFCVDRHGWPGKRRPVHHDVQHRDWRHLGRVYRPIQFGISNAPFEYQWRRRIIDRAVIRRGSPIVHCQSDRQHRRRTANSGASDERPRGDFLRPDACLNSLSQAARQENGKNDLINTF